jgi:DNA polymerase-3 subunit epsilon
MSPCLNDLDPNLYRRKLDEALGLFTGAGDGGAALLAHIDAQMRAAAADELFERAAWLHRRRERIGALVRALGALQATHAQPRLVLAPHPRGARRYDAFWLADGRVVDWDPLEAAGDIDARSAGALRVAGSDRAAAQLPRDAVAEARIVQTWLAAHADAPALVLGPTLGPTELAGFVARATRG